MGKKKIEFKDVCPGYCYVPVSSEEDMHEFGLYNEEGTEIGTGYFSSAERAKEKAEGAFGNISSCEIRDLDEEWYISIALRYRNYIKKLHPSFKKSSIILDMTRLYYKHCPVEWYVYIPFTYNGSKWCYRENASKEWEERVRA